MFLKKQKTTTQILFCLSTGAVYYLGSHGSRPRSVCCRLCCRGDGCRFGHSGGGSCHGCIADGGWNSVRLRSAGLYCRWSPGVGAAEWGRCPVASSRLHLHLHLHLHLQAAASAEAWGSPRSPAQAAASDAATSYYSTVDE